MRKVDLTETIQLLLRAVAEKGPDFIYQRRLEGCQNFDEDRSPSCIVGHVYHYLGVEYLADALNHSGHPTVKIHLENDHKIKFDDKSNYLLISVQKYQDAGWPWGRAVGRSLARMIDSSDEEE